MNIKVRIAELQHRLINGEPEVVEELKELMLQEEKPAKEESKAESFKGFGPDPKKKKAE